MSVTTQLPSQEALADTTYCTERERGKYRRTYRLTDRQRRKKKEWTTKYIAVKAKERVVQNNEAGQ
jgi:hypothetical protein